MELVVHCWIWCTALLHTGETFKVLGEYGYWCASHRQTQRSGSPEDGCSLKVRTNPASLITISV
jgi:hypothetical protein